MVGDERLPTIQIPGPLPPEPEALIQTVQSDYCVSASPRYTGEEGLRAGLVWLAQRSLADRTELKQWSIVDKWRRSRQELDGHDQVQPGRIILGHQEPRSTLPGLTMRDMLGSPARSSGPRPIGRCGRMTEHVPAP